MMDDNKITSEIKNIDQNLVHLQNEINKHRTILERFRDKKNEMYKDLGIGDKGDVVEPQNPEYNSSYSINRVDKDFSKRLLEKDNFNIFLGNPAPGKIYYYKDNGDSFTPDDNNTKEFINKIYPKLNNVGKKIIDDFKNNNNPQNVDWNYNNRKILNSDQINIIKDQYIYSVPENARNFLIKYILEMIQTIEKKKNKKQLKKNKKQLKKKIC